MLFDPSLVYFFPVSVLQLGGFGNSSLCLVKTIVPSPFFSYAPFFFHPLPHRCPHIPFNFRNLVSCFVNVQNA